MKTRQRWILTAVQGGLAVALIVFVGRAISAHWSEFRALSVSLTVRPGPLALAALTTLGTYGLLIEAWRRVLRGWGHRLQYAEAAFVWTVSNLGRYIPGKVWTIAGLTALARRAGVGAGAAAASAMVMQALAVATGAAVTVLALPGVADRWALLAAIGVAVAAVGAMVWEPTGGRVVRVLGGGDKSRPMPLGTAVTAAGATLASWVTHGLAFWLVSSAVLPGGPPALATTIPAFAAGYIIGLVALFAPGGIGVREAVLVAVLAPIIGAGDAVTATVASRLFLTLMELGVAAAMSLDRWQRKESHGA